MKIGIAISVAILILIGLVVFMATLGVAEPATPATAPDKLVIISLPRDLPSLAPDADPDIDAGDRYDRTFKAYESAKRQLAGGSVNSSVADDFAARLIRAAQAGKIDHGFLDQRIALKPGTKHDFNEAFEGIADLTLSYAGELLDAGKRKQAAQIAQAAFVLGHRTVTHNTRLDARYKGLMLMQMSLSILYDAADAVDQPSITAEDVAAWADPIERMTEAWLEKIKIVRSVKPNIGDLINIAQNDQDLTFRVAAILQLGAMQYNPGSRGNQRAIDSVLADLANDADPLISDAAKSAQAFTVEELRKMS